jgi:hypothetical protein
MRNRSVKKVTLPVSWSSVPFMEASFPHPLAVGAWRVQVVTRIHAIVMASGS